MPTKEQIGCIFCGARLGTDTREAHAVSNFLGGRKKSKRTECSDCNGYFAELEDEVGEALRPFSGSIGAVTGRGDPIIARPEPQGVDGETRLWKGLAELPLPAPVITFREGKKLRRQVLPHGEADQVKVIAHGLFEDNNTVEDLDAGLAELEFEPWPARTKEVNLGSFTVSLGSRAHCRAFTKMAVSLLGCYHETAARSGYLVDARNFARHDVGKIPFYFERTTVGSGLFNTDEVPSFAHRVEVWATGGKLVMRASFFGSLSASAKLAAWPCPPVAAAYVIDPRGMRHPQGRKGFQEGPALGLWHLGSSDEVSVALKDLLGPEIARLNALANQNPPAPPDPDKLLPLVRVALASLWAMASPEKRRKLPKKRRIRFLRLLQARAGRLAGNGYAGLL